MLEKSPVSRWWLVAGALFVLLGVALDVEADRSALAIVAKAATFGSLYVWMAISFPPGTRAVRKLAWSLTRDDRSAVFRSVRRGAAQPEPRLVPAVITVAEFCAVPLGYPRTRMVIQLIWIAAAALFLVAGIARGSWELIAGSALPALVAAGFHWEESRRHSLTVSAHHAMRESLAKYPPDDWQDSDR